MRSGLSDTSCGTFVAGVHRNFEDLRCDPPSLVIQVNLEIISPCPVGRSKPHRASSCTPVQPVPPSGRPGHPPGLSPGPCTPPSRGYITAAQGSLLIHLRHVIGPSDQGFDTVRSGYVRFLERHHPRECQRPSEIPQKCHQNPAVGLEAFNLRCPVSRGGGVDASVGMRS